MGKMEKESKRRANRIKIKKMILQTVATAGLISVAMVAPNILVSLKKLGLIPKRLNIKRSRDSLVNKGLLYYDGNFLKLTQKGERELRRIQLTDFYFKKPKKWDNKWRVLIFDIPEKRRKIRENIRTTLVSIGFIRLQNSVWVYPYDCEDYINLLKADLKIGKDLLYMIVDSIEYDKNLRKIFSLPD